MRVIENYKEGGFKVTIFKTDVRYLIQLEDERYMLSWKLPIETDYNVLKQAISDKMVPLGKNTWPNLQDELRLTPHTGLEKENDFPQII